MAVLHGPTALRGLRRLNLQRLEAGLPPSSVCRQPEAGVIVHIQHENQRSLI